MQLNAWDDVAQCLRVCFFVWLWGREENKSCALFVLAKRSTVSWQPNPQKVGGGGPFIYVLLGLWPSQHRVAIIAIMRHRRGLRKNIYIMQRIDQLKAIYITNIKHRHKN